MDKATDITTAVIIVAGGAGARMGGTIAKQFRILEGQPVLARTINIFAEALPTARIMVVLPEEQIDFWHDLAARFTVARHSTTIGGRTRFDSVRAGLMALDTPVDYIAVQDGVRPLGSVEFIRRTLDCAVQNRSAVPVIEPADSFRVVDGDTSRIIDRHILRSVQTPQIFAADTLRDSFLRATNSSAPTSYTDDASVVEAAGYRITLCEGEPTNLKITTPCDMLFATAVLQERAERIEDQTARENSPTHARY